MRYSFKKVFPCIVVFSFVLALFACKDSSPHVVRLEVLEIFRVEGDEATKRPTVLRYKDVKNYNQDGILVQQNFYNVDNSLKGYEFIKKDGNTGVTNYYDADSNLLAIYELEYNANLISKRVGYDGSTKELLRTEVFNYNGNGQMISKTILDQKGKTSGSFDMHYDADGNEILFEMKGSDGQLISKESFVIIKVNEEKKWTERWGYIDEQPNSFHRRSFSNEQKQ